MDGTSPTLRALLGRRDLGLRLDGQERDLADGALDHPIRWVHGTDLLDPTPFLSEGMVLLTTGTQFAGSAFAREKHRDRSSGSTGAAPPTRGEELAEASLFDDYVQRLSARGVLGLGFGTEVVRDGIPPALATACARERMPLFEVPYRTPFIAVARANAEAIAAQAYARRGWSLAAQRAISLAALRPDGLGATLAELARQLSTWVGLFDASGVLTREHPPGSLDGEVLAELTDEVGILLRRGARAGSSLRIADTPFTLQTLGRGGHLRGVVAIAAGELDQEGRGVVTAVIAMAGLALEQSQSLSHARELLRSGLVQSLLTGDAALARRVARDLWGGLPAGAVLVGVLHTAATRVDALWECVELRAGETHGGVFHGRGDEGMVVVCAAADDAVFADLATRFDARIGVSAPASYAGFAAAHAQAVTALGRGRGAVTRFEQIAASGMQSAFDTTTARALAGTILAPVLEHDARHGSELGATLRAWLSGDARIDAAAAALGVHRHTVRARIGHAESLLGMDLSSFTARAELWAALVATGRGD